MGAEVHAKLLEIVPSYLDDLLGFVLAYEDADRYANRKLCLRRFGLRRWYLPRVHSLDAL